MPSLAKGCGYRKPNVTQVGVLTGLVILRNDVAGLSHFNKNKIFDSAALLREYPKGIIPKGIILRWVRKETQ